MPRDNRPKHRRVDTVCEPTKGEFRVQSNPIQFAVNPLGMQNLYGYRARDFSGKRANPENFARAVEILGKLVSSKGSQAKHRMRREGTSD